MTMVYISKHSNYNNFNCKTKNRQTQIKGWGREIQIGAGDQGQGRGPGNTNTPLPTPFFHFSIIAKRQCCALYSFLNPHLIFREKFVHIYIIICFDSNISNILEIIGSILTGR